MLKEFLKKEKLMVGMVWIFIFKLVIDFKIWLLKYC